MITSAPKDPFTSVLFGKTRRAVLALLYGHPEEAYYLRQIVRMTGIGLGPVQRELGQLTDGGIITREYQGSQVYYRANKNCPIFDEIKSIVRKTFGIADVLREALSSARDRIITAFIFGSVAKAQDVRASDIDLMVIGDVTFGEIVSIIGPAHDILHREINPVVYPVSEFLSRVKEGHYFTNDVLSGPKIFVIGDEHDLGRLVQAGLDNATQSTEP